MKYRRNDAKDYARAKMRGIWAAALMPFAPDLSVDEAGFRRNLRHWVDELGIDGIFIAGDWTAAPGLLSEVAWASAVDASRRALELSRAPRPSLRRVA